MALTCDLKSLTIVADLPTYKLVPVCHPLDKKCARTMLELTVIANLHILNDNFV